MNRTERNFYNDVKEAVSDWDCSFSTYHEDDDYGNNLFCVDVTVEDDDADWSEVWDALEEVADDWDAGIDQSMNEFYLALDMSD